MDTLTDTLCDELEVALSVDPEWEDPGLSRARAFSRGSDARLAGRTLRDCPYFAGTLATYWCNGWHDVDRGWGAGVRGRWGYRPLPVVM